MAGRALLAFLICPGIVAYGLPGLLIWSSTFRESSIRFLGMGAVVFGSGLLLWCTWAFYMEGRGTLAPWAPPQVLVRDGLYRFSRNPMYLAVELVLFGWAAWFQSLGLILYAISGMMAFHLRIVFVEEPWLAKRYGLEWKSYCASVPRWLK